MNGSLTMRPRFDADWIAPKLWVGSIMMGPVDAEPFDAIVIAAIEHADIGIDESKKVVVPLHDTELSAQEADMALDAALLVNSYRNAGRRVAVLCSMGINRSSLIASLALAAEGDPDPIGRVRSHRVAPDAPAMALRNRSFVEFVKARVARRDLMRASAGYPS